ncbi:LytTR family DNA-binding domain-containing protein [Dyella sedimenti]|uniref:LytTR family DNA-binding domain-containing protein n=1 Tax=Dyella sedimenti TaxID=2919947 RepID=UPI001FAB3340|nr:LytTR family DNA-binding domain-containing protein [Dyella sedimenti]
MDNETLQHRLQRLDLGMVWVDRQNRVIGFNDVAWQLLAPAGEQTLGVSREELIGIDLLRLHPAKSREKIALLLGGGEPSGVDRCPVRSPPPVTMMINIPDRVLLLKVSKMFNAEGVVGACMVYYDLTEITTTPHDDDTPSPLPRPPRRLNKIPVYRANRLVLIEVDDTLRLESNDHYTWIVTATDRYLSNLSLSDLEERLDPARFFRCHRSHIVNLHHVHEIERDGELMYIVYDRPELARVPVSRSHARELREMVGL